MADIVSITRLNEAKLDIEINGKVYSIADMLKGLEAFQVVPEKQ